MAKIAKNIPTISNTKIQDSSIFDFFNIDVKKSIGEFFKGVLDFTVDSLEAGLKAWEIKIKLSELELQAMQVENSTLNFIDFNTNIKNSLIQNKMLQQQTMNNARQQEFYNFIVSFLTGTFTNRDVGVFNKLYNLNKTKEDLESIRDSLIQKDYHNALLKLLGGTFKESDNELIKKVFDSSGTVQADDLNKLFSILDSEGNSIGISRLLYEILQYLNIKIIK